jgi:T-complex protein 10 C-terminus
MADKTSSCFKDKAVRSHCAIPTGAAPDARLLCQGHNAFVVNQVFGVTPIWKRLLPPGALNPSLFVRADLKFRAILSARGLEQSTPAVRRAPKTTMAAFNMTASDRACFARDEGASLSPGTSSLLDLLDITADDPTVLSLLSLEDADEHAEPPRRRRGHGDLRDYPRRQEYGNSHRPLEATGTDLAARSHVAKDSSDSSVNTNDLLRFMEEFTLGSPHTSAVSPDGALDGYNCNPIKKKHGTKARTHPLSSSNGRTCQSATPRQDNRTVSSSAPTASDRDAAAQGQLSAAAPTGISEHQHSHLQQWACQLRTAVQTWVQAQREQQEKNHSTLEKQLQEELKQQQATIDSLQAVVESQQAFLQTFLRPAPGSKSQRPHPPPPPPIAQTATTHDVLPTAAIDGPSSRADRSNQWGNNPSSLGIFRETLAPLSTNGVERPHHHHHQLPRRPTSSTTKGSLGCASFRHRDVAPDGTRITVYANGTRKEQRSDGALVIYFANGDIQAVDRLGSSTAYWFADTQVVKLVDNDPTSDSVLYQFPNGQVERHYSDGRKLVQFRNNTTRWIVS